MEQIKILKIIDKYAKGESTLAELLGDVKQYCDYHNDKMNEATRRIFELEIENSLMRRYIGEIFLHYKNSEKDGIKLTDATISFKERARQLLDYTIPTQDYISHNLPRQVKFELQKIALADDEMVSNAKAAITYREMIRDILDRFS